MEALQEYLALTRKQTTAIGADWTDKDRTRLLELQDELERQKGSKILTVDEWQEYLALTREQTESKNWTPQKSARLLELQDGKPPSNR
jgi:site-specific DNA-adenine methylase